MTEIFLVHWKVKAAEKFGELLFLLTNTHLLVFDTLTSTLQHKFDINDYELQYCSSGDVSSSQKLIKVCVKSNSSSAHSIETSGVKFSDVEIMDKYLNLVSPEVVLQPETILLSDDRVDAVDEAQERLERSEENSQHQHEDEEMGRADSDIDFIMLIGDAKQFSSLYHRIKISNISGQ